MHPSSFIVTTISEDQGYKNFKESNFKQILNSKICFAYIFWILSDYVFKMIFIPATK